jgi:hypothetical protein
MARLRSETKKRQLRQKRADIRLKDQWPFLGKHTIVSERTKVTDEIFDELCYNGNRRTGLILRYGDAH